MFSRPIAIPLAVAIFGVLALLIVNHGPWNRPRVQTSDTLNYTTTVDAARAAGATVTPTAPHGQLESVPPDPKPAHPENPVTP